MKMLKRISLICLLCIILALGTVLAGCQGGDSPNTSDNPSVGGSDSPDEGPGLGDSTPTMQEVAGKYYLWDSEIIDYYYIQLDSDGTGKEVYDMDEETDTVPFIYSLKNHQISFTMIVGGNAVRNYTFGLRDGIISYAGEYFCKEGIDTPYKEIGKLRYSIGVDGNYKVIGLTDENAATVTIPSQIDGVDVTSIDRYALDDCENLVYNEYDNALYLGNDDNKYVILAKAKDSDITTCTINDATAVIAPNAFADCDKLESIKITDKVKTIGAGAFENCTGLQSVTISDGVTTIEESAFENCSSLANITIPNSVTYVDYDVFRDCSGLTSATISTGLKIIEGGMFSGCRSLANVTIPDGITNIGERAFYMCSSLDDITIPDKVIYIGQEAFLHCGKLKNVSIPSGILSIEENAFSGCDSLKYNEFDNGLYLGNDGNKFLVLVAPKNKNITSCNINEQTKLVYFSAFEECERLKSIVIPESVEIIEGYAFQNCTNLESATILGSGVYIGHCVFFGCSNLKEVSIQGSVRYIGARSFFGCNLENLTFNGTMVEWNDIEKDETWNDGIDCAIHCADGDIAKDE